MEYLLTSIIVIILFCVYMLFRNRWVLRKQLEWIDKVSDCRMKMIRKHDFETLDKISYRKMKVSVAGFNEMYLRFWCYDLNKFIKNREIFEMVLYGDSNSRIIPFPVSSYSQNHPQP